MRRKIDTQGVPLGAFWWARIQRALDDRKNEEADWNKNLEMANSADFKVEGVEDTDVVWQNIILANLKWMVPNLCSQYPEFVTRPQRKDDEKTYRLAQMNINRAAKNVKLKRETRKATKDTLITSVGYLKVGWQFEVADISHEFDDNGRDVWDDKSTVLPFSALKLEQTLIGLGTGPFTVRVSPWNLVRSPGSTSIRNAAWACERIYMRLGDLKAIPGIKHANRLQGNATTRDVRHTTGSRAISTPKGMDPVPAARALSDPDDNLVECWECWDLPSQSVYLITPEDEDDLRTNDWPSKNLRGIIPYIEFQFFDLPDQSYSISHVSGFRSLVVAKNKLEAYKMLDAKTSTKRVVFNADQFDPEQQQQLQDGEIGSMTPCTGDFNTAIGTWGGGEVAANLQYADTSLQSGIDMMSNQSDAERGQAADQRQLATVATYKVQASGVRLDDMKDSLLDSLIEWAELMDLLHKEFQDEEVAIRTAGTDGFEWTEYSKQDLQGQYEYDIVPGSLQKYNVEAQQELWLKLINILQPLFAPGTNLDGKAAVRQLLNAFPISEPEKILGEMPDVPPSDPEEENFWMLEGGNPPVSKREDFQAHIAAHLQAIQVLEAQPEPDIRAIDRIKKHLEKTQETQVKAMIEAEMKARMDAEIQAQLAAGAEGIERGPGNGGPAKGGPARPRQFAEGNTSEAKILGAQHREGAPA